jgi:hypothetical protein
MAGAAAGPDAELFDLIAAAREAKARYDASTAARRRHGIEPKTCLRPNR